MRRNILHFLFFNVSQAIWFLWFVSIPFLLRCTIIELVAIPLDLDLAFFIGEMVNIDVNIILFIFWRRLVELLRLLHFTTFRLIVIDVIVSQNFKFCIHIILSEAIVHGGATLIRISSWMLNRICVQVFLYNFFSKGKTFLWFQIVALFVILSDSIEELLTVRIREVTRETWSADSKISKDICILTVGYLS